MDLKTYQQEAWRTCPDLGLLDNHVHMLLGIQTESAELSDIWKKKIAYKKEIDWINFKEEIGDMMWYISNLCKMNDWNLEDILQKNIDKLKIRYPEKFTEEKALNRDLNAERQSLH